MYHGSNDLLLVANGKTLTFIDYQVGQKSSWPLGRTPLGVLLSGSPDLKGRAQIVPSSNSNVVSVRARDPTQYGSLTLVFGVMDFINLAHGVQYMLGAYLGASLASLTGSFWGGLLLALPATLASGLVLEWLVFRHLYDRDHLSQVLATFGVILFLNEAVKLDWGTAAEDHLPNKEAAMVSLSGGETAFEGWLMPSWTPEK